MTLKHWGVLLLTAALFGASFLFIKTAVAELPPLPLAAARVAIAAVAMVAFLIASGGRLPPLGRGWVPLLVLGVLTAAVPYFAIAWGQTRIPSSLGGILFATIPIFTVVIAPMVTPEARLTPLRMLGVAVAFGGVVLAVGPGSLLGGSGQADGAFVTLIAALSYAVGNIYARMQTGLSPVVMAVGQLVTGALILVPLSLLVTPVPLAGLALSHAATGSVLAVALLSTALPVLLMFWLVRNAGATNTSIVAFFIPVAAVVLGAVVLSEPVTLATLGGFGAILGGAGLATGMIKGRA